MGIAFPTYFFPGATPSVTVTTQEVVSVAPIAFSGPLSHPVAPPF